MAFGIFSFKTYVIRIFCNFFKYTLFRQMLHAVALMVLAIILREPELLKRLHNEGAIVPLGEESPAPLPTPLSNIDPPAHPYTNHRPHSLVYRKLKSFLSFFFHTYDKINLLPFD